MPDFTELKQKHRKAWASGDYDQIARGIVAVADHVVRVARVRACERVLDVACAGNVEHALARAHARDAHHMVGDGHDAPRDLVVVARGPSLSVLLLEFREIWHLHTSVRCQPAASAFQMSTAQRHSPPGSRRVADKARVRHAPSQGRTQPRRNHPRGFTHEALQVLGPAALAIDLLRGLDRA